MKIAVSTDTSCLLNDYSIKKYPIFVLPLNVIVDGEEFLDGVTINQEKLYLDMNAKKTIKTSTPPLGSIVEYFENILSQGYDKVIHFTISSKLSSMFELFTLASKNYLDEKIVVVDSLGVSLNMFSQVIYTYEEITKGTEIDVILEALKERKNNNHLCCAPENLVTLKNGGRVSPAIAAIGNTIGLKPMLVFKDGALEKDGMIRNVKKAFFDKLDEYLEKCPIADYDYALVDFYGNEKVVNAIIDYFDEKNLGYSLVRGIVPINVCAHCGPGTIALTISPKINGKSIHEYL